MGGILAAAIEAITEGLKLAQITEARKYTDQMVELQLAIQKEEDRGDDSDDAKIESFYKQLEVVMGVVRDELRAAVVPKS